MAKLNNNGLRLVRAGFDDTKGWDFKKLKEFVGKTVPVNGFFVTTGGEYGESLVVIADDVLINMPARALEEFTNLFINGNYTQDLLDGKIELRNIEEIKVKKGKTVAYDIELLE